MTVNTDAIRIDSRIEASELEVGRFPPTWGFKPEMSGKLTGVAVLKVVVNPRVAAADIAAVMALTVAFGSAALLAFPWETTVHTAGSGKGRIIDAVVGQVRAGSIDLELHAVPGGFRFGNFGK